MFLLSYIVWDPNPELFPELLQDWNISPRYYGLLFALGFLISQQVLFYIFRKEGKPERDVETLTIFMVVATLVGARLGHVLFYEPELYLPNPGEILKVWKGGLASHGAAVGILIGLYLYVNYLIEVKVDSRFPFLHVKAIKRKKEGQSYLWVVDRIVIVVAFTGSLIRLGNFINSEIIGRPADIPFGVVFARAAEESIISNPAIESVEASKGGNREEEDIYKPVLLTVNFKRDDFQERGIRNYLESEVKHILSSYQVVTEHFHEPDDEPLQYELTRQANGAFQANIHTWGISRHPAQLYESISSMLLFIFLLLVWNRRKEKTPEGLLFGLFLIVLFTLRFIYEFFKEVQVAFEENIPLNMGQILSIPFIIAGIYLLFRVKKKSKPQGTGS